MEIEIFLCNLCNVRCPLPVGETYEFPTNCPFDKNKKPAFKHMRINEVELAEYFTQKQYSLHSVRRSD
jgi:hypothetical protein